MLRHPFLILRPFVALSVLYAAGFCHAENYRVQDPKELDAAVKQVKPGDQILLSGGVWKDEKIKFVAQGTAREPIVLKAEVPGETIFTGDSSLRIGGDYLIVEGLQFQNPTANISSVIEFRKDSKRLSNHCRLTNCAISNPKATEVKNSQWVGLYGSENRVDHCTFSGKTGKGTTFVVWLDEDKVGLHHIDHNHFGRREELGGNGGETIRIGDSNTSMIRAQCLVEYNLFEQCNGETECISNKSCGNVYQDNLFIEVAGTLTLRHGNDCLVQRNIFLGKEASKTGGVRIIGEEHIVRNNYFEGLTGDKARSAICLMTGIPNSPANRYFQVKRARVEGNVLVDCKHPILIGLSDDKNASLPPVETIFQGNVVGSSRFPVIESRCDLSGITWKGNRFSGPELFRDKNGTRQPISGIEYQEKSFAASRPSMLNRNEVGATYLR